MISMKNLRIASRQGAKVRCQGPPCTDCTDCIISYNGDMKLSIAEVPPGPQEASGELGHIGLTVSKVLLSIGIQGHSTNGTNRIIHWLKNFTRHIHSIFSL